MSGTAQDVTDLRNADEQAAEATRRLFLLQQMAMAANRATTLREALLIAGAGVPEHTTLGGGLRLPVRRRGDEPEFLDLGGGAPAIAPDPDLAERARATRARSTVGTPSELAEHPHPGRDAGARSTARSSRVVELLADEVPPDENSHQLMTPDRPPARRRRRARAQRRASSPRPATTRWRRRGSSRSSSRRCRTRSGRR